MKKLLAIAVLAIVATTSCKKAKDIAKTVTQINTDIQYDQTLALTEVDHYLDSLHLMPGTVLPGGLALDFPPMPLPSNSQSFLDQYNTSADKVISAKLKALRVEQGLDTGNFNFADSIMVYLSSKTLPEVLVAYVYNIPKNSKTIQLTPVDQNLKTYFLQDTFYFREHVWFNSVPQRGSSINIKSTWNLIANPLN